MVVQCYLIAFIPEAQASVRCGFVCACSVECQGNRCLHRNHQVTQPTDLHGGASGESFSFTSRERESLGLDANSKALVFDTPLPPGLPSVRRAIVSYSAMSLMDLWSYRPKSALVEHLTMPFISTRCGRQMFVAAFIPEARRRERPTAVGGCSGFWSPLHNHARVELK